MQNKIRHACKEDGEQAANVNGSLQSLSAISDVLK